MRFESDALGGSRLDAVPDRTGRPRPRGLGRGRCGGRARGVAVGRQPVAVLSYKAYADYDIADADAAVALPDALAGQPFPGEPLGCAMNIFRRSDITAGQTVAIMGRLPRCHPDPARDGRRSASHRRIAPSFSLDVARAMGAVETVPLEDHDQIIGHVRELTQGTFCDRVIEAVGKQWPLDLAAELTRERGRLIVAGYHQDGPRNVNMQLWNWRGLDVINAHERDPKIYREGMREAVNAVASGRLDWLPLHAHLPPHRLDQALDATRDRPDGFLKALVTEMMQVPFGEQAAAVRPRLGFLGVSWIGRHRMKSILETGAVEIAGIADASAAMAAEAGRLAPEAKLVGTLDDLVDLEVDGVVIATPSAMHAEQSIRVLEQGAAVFCQKPLGRTAAVRAVVDAARAADRLIGVDLSYRFTTAMRLVRDLVRSGELGRIFAVDLVFHNAYGPDKPWFYDPISRAGGASWTWAFTSSILPSGRWTSARLPACVEPCLPG